MVQQMQCQAKKEGEGELIYSNGDRFKGWGVQAALPVILRAKHVGFCVHDVAKVNGLMTEPPDTGCSFIPMAIATMASG